MRCFRSEQLGEWNSARVPKKSSTRTITLYDNSPRVADRRGACLFFYPGGLTQFVWPGKHKKWQQYWSEDLCGGTQKEFDEDKNLI